MNPKDTTGVKALSVAAFVLAGIGVLLFAARLLFGVDFIDEAFYAATAYRFATGAKPFVSDVDLHQTAALITAPWVRLHLLILGDTTGLILSLRLLWAIMNGAAAFLAFRFLRRIIDTSVAALCAVCAFGVMPYMIPAPSYNTMAVAFSSMALSLIGARLLEDSEKRPYDTLVAGALLALAVLAYPSLVVLALACVALLRLLTGTWKQSYWLLAGGLATGLVLLLGLAPYLSSIPGLVREAAPLGEVFGWGAGGAGLFDKALQLIMPLAIAGAASVSFWLAAAAGGLQAARRPVPLWLALALVAAIPFGFGAPVDVRTLTFSISVLVSASIIAATGRAKREGALPLPVRLLRFSCLYGVITGFTLAFTSGIGARYIGLGGAAVLAPAIAVLVARVKASGSRAKLGSTALLGAQLAVPTILLVALVYFTWTGYYRDVPPLQADSSVRTGPHAGLRTSSANAEDIEAFWTAMQLNTSPQDRVFAFHGLPAAYLYTQATPSSRMLWSISYDAIGVSEPSDTMVRELSDPKTAPDFVVRNVGWPTPQVLAQNAISAYDPTTDRVARFVSERYEVIERGRNWELLRRSDDTETPAP